VLADYEIGKRCPGICCPCQTEGSGSLTVIAFRKGDSNVSTKNLPHGNCNMVPNQTRACAEGGIFYFLSSATKNASNSSTSMRLLLLMILPCCGPILQFSQLVDTILLFGFACAVKYNPVPKSPRFTRISILPPHMFLRTCVTGLFSSDQTTPYELRPGTGECELSLRDATLLSLGGRIET
jgi:hypothetical protein